MTLPDRLSYRNRSESWRRGPGQPVNTALRDIGFVTLRPISVSGALWHAPTWGAK